MATTTSKLVTYEEWLTMPETEGREEVVDGVIIPMPPNKSTHREIVDELHAVFVVQLDRKLYRVTSSSWGLVIRTEPFTCRCPDLAVFVRKTMVERDGYTYSPPELVVEVLSPSNTRRYMSRKIADYESIGVPELWILSPDSQSIEVLQLQDGKLRRVQWVAEGQLRPLRFPDSVVDVAAIWPE